MVRQHYNFLVSTTYFPDTQDYNDQQRRKASFKLKMVHLLHALFLVLITWSTVLVLKDNSPTLNYFLHRCENRTVVIEEERQLFAPVKHLNRAVGELGQLINTSSSNLTYHASNIGNVMDILKNTTDAAEKTYDAKFGDYRPCVHAAVDIFNMYFNTLVSGLFASFVVIFLLSFLIRETFFTYFVKKEFTEAGWKKEAYFNTVMTCIWTIVGVYFLYYLYNVAENGNSARHGRVVSYFSTH